VKFVTFKRLLIGALVTEWDDLRMLLHRGRTIFEHGIPEHFLGYVLEGKTPIILLSGLHAHWSKLRRIGDHISLNGHPLYVVESLKRNFIDIPSSAKMLHEFVEENKIKEAIIIAHSKGGMIGKYYLAHFNKDNRVKGLIAIATPFSGTEIARVLGRRIHRLRELETDSELVTDLKKHSEVNSKIISIYPDDDPVVWAGEKFWRR